jgi:hypothetical protein
VYNTKPKLDSITLAHWRDRKSQKEREREEDLLNRKIRIISWLIPRFHNGLSDPKNYEELIGRVEK